MRLATILTAALSSLVLSSCAAAAIGAIGTVGVVAFQERSFGTALDDSTLSSEIKSKLIARGGYGEVDVEVASGLVLLSGRVKSEDMRLRAEEVAWSARRTADVANEIQIEGTKGVRGNLSDEFITARLRTRILTSPSVRGINFNIETYNGVVYLMGIARSEEELRKAAEIASTTRGVKEVVSYVQLRDSVTRPSFADNRPAIADDELFGAPEEILPRGAAGRAYSPANKVVKYEDIADGEW